MTNKWFRFVIIFFLVLLMAFIGARIYLVQTCLNTSKTFLTLVGNGQLDKAKSMSRGQVKFNLSNQAKNAPAGKVVSVDSKAISYSPSWAHMKCSMEILLQDGLTDVGWYDIYMEKEGSWKVYAIHESLPEISGYSLFYRKNKAFEEVFAKYLRAVEKGQLTESRQYLIGPALKAQDQNVITGQVLGKCSGISIDPIYGTQKYAVCKVHYSVDQREVNLVVQFYKISEGWKILLINSSL